jgi:hypothetical protein
MGEFYRQKNTEVEQRKKKGNKEQIGYFLYKNLRNILLSDSIS